MSPLSLPTALPDSPTYHTRLTAGPSQQYEFTAEAREWVDGIAQASHRSQVVKDMMREKQRATRRALGASEGWALLDLKGGTEAQRYASMAAIPLVGESDKTVLVHTDNFSKVFGGEYEAAGGQVDERIVYERGDALLPDTEVFESLALRVERGEIAVLILTENGTATGTYQSLAIEELIKRRDAAGSPTRILVDAVSSQVLAGGRAQLPDALFWGYQKDLSVGGGASTLLMNPSLVQHAHARAEAGFLKGKLNPVAELKKGDLQHSTTPTLRELARAAIVMGHFWGPGSEEHLKLSQAQDAGLKLLSDSVDSGELGALGVQFRAQNPELRSKSSHVLVLPGGVHPREVVERMAEREIAISTGYGAFGKTDQGGEVRLCNYSAVTEDQFKNAVGEFTDVLRDLMA